MLPLEDADSISVTSENVSAPSATLSFSIGTSIVPGTVSVLSLRRREVRRRRTARRHTVLHRGSVRATKCTHREIPQSLRPSSSTSTAPCIETSTVPVGLIAELSISPLPRPPFPPRWSRRSPVPPDCRSMPAVNDSSSLTASPSRRWWPHHLPCHWSSSMRP